MFNNAFKDKRVWLSGHTGFKGAWLSEWLLLLGADVYGYALAPDTQPSLFEQLGLATRLHHEIADVRDPQSVRASLERARPDFVFHLAAQPLVRRSYSEPVETYASNVMGTINVLESLRSIARPCSAVMVTTDKCYENREHGVPYREEDHLGGRDPYSSSKAMAEIAIAAYRQSYFSTENSPLRVASARAGNVIGGGDWALDRILPDCMRALQSGAPIPVRNRLATRPWQHVLEPLSGYLWLAATMAQSVRFPSALNFGPHPESNRSVEELVLEILHHWPGEWLDQSDPTSLHEAKLLSLSIEKASQTLNWKPVWNFRQTLLHTVEWYRSIHLHPVQSSSLTHTQLAAYYADAKSAKLAWT